MTSRRPTSRVGVDSEHIEQRESNASSEMVESGSGFETFLHQYVDSILTGEADMVDLHARIMEAVERPLFSKVLAGTGGNQIRAAAILGLNRNTLRKRLKVLGIASNISRRDISADRAMRGISRRNVRGAVLSTRER